MRRPVAALLLTATLVLPALALAHGGGHRAHGVVKEVGAARLVVTDEHGKDTAFALAPGTRYFRDRKPIQREALVAGERVVVKGKDTSGQLEATTVDVGGGSKLPR